MAEITLKEYAKKHGKAERTVRQKASLGNFKTAHKPGRDWLIDENEPYDDMRFKMRINEFNTYPEALEYLKSITADDTLFTDGVDEWDLYNLIDANGENLLHKVADNPDEIISNSDSYYIVNPDALGFTDDNGNNVDWILRII